VNRQDPIIIDFVASASMSPLADNSTSDLSFRRTANNERIGTLCMKPSSHQGNLQSVSSANRSLKRLGPQHYIPEVKLNEPSTAVLASQVGQKPEEPIPTQGVCILDGIRKKVFEYK
jgi:hypothetical protein